MSGAKKKLAQKEAMAQMGLTEKEKKALKEAAAKKRNTILGITGGIILAVLVVALLVWNSGVIARHTTALEVNGHKYTVADMDFYYHRLASNAYYNELSTAQFYEQMAAQGQDFGTYTPAFDLSQDLKTQYVDEEKTQSFHDYFLEQAKSEVTRLTALSDAAKSAGYTPTEDAQTQIDTLLSSLDAEARSNNVSGRSAYLRMVFGRTVTDKVYRDNMAMAILAEDYSTTTQNGLTDYSDDDLKAYYNENTSLYNSYDYDYAYFDGTPVKETDDDNNPIEPTDAQKTEAMAAAKEKAEGLVAAVKAAPAEGETATSFATAAAVYNISGTTRTRYLAASHFAGSVYADWLMDPARQDGDIEMFEAEGNGYYVIQFHASYFYDEPTVDVRHILIRAETDEGAETNEYGVAIPTQAQMDAAKAKAEDLMKQFNLGEKTADSFGEMAEEHSDDGRDSEGNLQTEGGLYSGVHKGDMVQNFNDWIFDAARKEGDVGLVENAGPGYYGWHVVYFQASHEPEWKSQAKTTKGNADKTAWSESVQEGYEAVETSAFSKVGA